MVFCDNEYNVKKRHHPSVSNCFTIQFLVYYFSPFIQHQDHAKLSIRLDLQLTVSFLQKHAAGGPFSLFITKILLFETKLLKII